MNEAAVHTSTGFETRNPARPDEVVAHYQADNAASIDACMDRARAAQAGWAGTPLATRVHALARWLAAIEQDVDTVAQAITREQGKPLAESRAETAKALREARAMLAFAQGHGGDTLAASRGGYQNLTLRRPRGVVLAIAPWNFPVLTPMRKLVPALVTGNAVVLKPSEATPMAAVVLARLAQGLLPQGVLQLVHGAGDVAAALCSHPDVAAISFTGSVTTGRKVAQAAGAALVPVSLELGGKNAAWIDEVADLERCLDAIHAAAFQCAGQRCTAISRVLAPRHRLDEVVQGLARRADALHLGEGDDPDTTLGPITTAAQWNKIDQLVRAAVAAGARLVCGGTAATVEACPGGRFYTPTILVCEDAANPAVQQEIFGPVLVVQPYTDTDEAVALLNGVAYGLTSSLFSDRFAVVMRYLAEAQTGMLHVNHGTAPDDHMPFVGVKDSGLGTGSVGRSTLDFFTTEHTAYLAA